jgi:hypothetical protein
MQSLLKDPVWNKAKSHHRDAGRLSEAYIAGSLGERTPLVCPAAQFSLFPLGSSSGCDYI